MGDYAAVFIILGIGLIAYAAWVGIDIIRDHRRAKSVSPWVSHSWGQRPQGETSSMFKSMGPGTKKGALHGQQLFKVTVANRSVHGGSFDWANYLPTKNRDGSYEPGVWTPVIANPAICHRGYHLTTDPYVEWAKPGMTVYEAEGRVAYSAYGDDITRVTDNKIAFAQVRLIRPVNLAFQTAQKVIADIKAQVAPRFLSAAPGTSPFFGVTNLTYDTAREAEAAFAAAGGGKGYPAVSTKGLDATQIDELWDLAENLTDSIPANRAHATEAFPINLAFCLAKYALAGQAPPAELTQRHAAYKAGFGVAGRAADGKLFLFRRW